MWAREWPPKPDLALGFRGSIPRGSTSGNSKHNTHIDRSQPICYNNLTSAKSGIGTISKQIKKSPCKGRFFVYQELVSSKNKNHLGFRRDDFCI